MKTSELLNKLQELELGNSYLFTKGTSAINISKTIGLNDIIFRKMGRFIGYAPPEDLPFERCNRVESFDFYAHKKSYTYLGVIMLELLFSDLSYLEIKVLNTQSEIRQFFVYIDRAYSYTPFLAVDQKETYKSFEYFSANIDRYPFRHHSGSENLPTFHFSCSNYHDIYTKDRIEKADQLILSVPVSGLVLVAELFLNIGRIENKQNEICLENPLYGFGGVSQTSIEARFWLPNSLGFYTDKIENLTF